MGEVKCFVFYLLRYNMSNARITLDTSLREYNTSLYQCTMMPWGPFHWFELITKLGKGS